jgi:hypothetical protein
MGPDRGERNVVGLQPWLPWPFSAWRWWTVSIRAECLAVLRIALASLMLLDLLWTYLPDLHLFYGKDSLGEPKMFAWWLKAPHWNWSILHGLGLVAVVGAVVAVWIPTTLWVLWGLVLRLRAKPESKPLPGLRWALIVWIAATVLGYLGFRLRLANISDGTGAAQVLQQSEKGDELPKVDEEKSTPGIKPGVKWFLSVTVALIPWLLATVFLVLTVWEKLRRQQGRQVRLLFPLVGIAWGICFALLLLGLWRMLQGVVDPNDPLSLSWAYHSWDEEPWPLDIALYLWIFATVCLLIGFCTRPSAIIAWLISVSFANMNTYNDNAGDAVRNITLFYLILGQSGAAWSVDSWLARWRGRRAPGPVYIYPWVLRLLFLQLTFIYFMNGVYKAVGPEWRKGSTLYYVLNDLTLTRWSFAQLPLTFELTRVLSISVMIWEVTFPFWMLLPWWFAGFCKGLRLWSRPTIITLRVMRMMRTIVLIFGVAFHLGIFLSMELGGFAPYMMILYLPLLPWSRWLSRRRQFRANR